MGRLILTLIIILSASMAHADRIFVVANKKAILKSVTREQVSATFLDQKRLEGAGGMLEPVDLPEGHALRTQFYEKFTGLSPIGVKKYWAKMIFTGKATPPKIARDEAELTRHLKQNPRGVGYLSDEPKDADLEVIFVAD